MTEEPTRRPLLDVAEDIAATARRVWFGTPRQKEKSATNRTALIEIDLEDGEIIDDIRGPFSKGIDGEYTLHIRTKQAPHPTKANPPTEQPAPTAADPADMAVTVRDLINAQRLLADEFRNLKRVHTATLDTLGSHVRPMIGDLAKRFADIDRTLVELRRDINFCLDQLKFQTFEPETTAPIPDTPDGPPMK